MITGDPIILIWITVTIISVLMSTDAAPLLVPLVDPEPGLLGHSQLVDAWPLPVLGRTRYSLALFRITVLCKLKISYGFSETVGHYEKYHSRATEDIWVGVLVPQPCLKLMYQVYLKFSNFPITWDIWTISEI